jgi:RNA polymerase sigma-70 factor, ECF subfamily
MRRDRERGGTQLPEALGFVDADRDESIRRLVESWKAGIDAEGSFAALFRRWYGRVVGTFARSQIPAGIREELAQEVFRKVHQYRASCPSERFERWLLRLARTTFLSWFESESRLKRRGREVSWEDVGPAEARAHAAGKVGEDLPIDHLLEHERAELLLRAVEELPERMRQCVLLHWYQDLSEAETAAILHIAVGTVKAHLHAARKRLRENLGAELRSVDAGGGGSEDR